MDTHEIKAWSKILMERHGLIEAGWKFELNDRKRAVGLCNYRTKTLHFSVHFLTNSEEEIVNTLLHEIAHALVGSGHGHNDVWRAMAYTVGCTGERCAAVGTVSTAEPKYMKSCDTCGWEKGVYRVTASTRRRICNKCKKTITVTKLR